ncbi:hypothetical protein LTT66_31925 [Nocardia gipuzkoensis]|uniref:hypothetical protein n=1 Tax=Nocardia gipuzkoensis TaxID=2749991 RepID=UPI001E2AAEA8|nr:hypothetical protein [Nocardia gipuzkoensis]UGT67753.1 hypothetical protein LTT66_31925 [Nocardia gipuzkoensis]
MFRLSWALALALTVAALTGILIVTRDLHTTRDVFARGVDEGQTIEVTTDKALAGAAQLPATVDSITRGLPSVIGVSQSMARADSSLAAMATNLNTLAAALGSADGPLGAVVASSSSAGSAATAAVPPVEHISDTLSATDAKAIQLGRLLDQTQVLSSTIDSKLRVALLLPKVGR